jgi:hypothetical protein
MRALGLLVLVALPLALHAQAPRTAVLYGLVLSDPNDHALADAEVVIVTTPGTTLVARSDSTGAFILKGIPAGIRQVIVRHLGNKPINTVVNFTAGDSLARDFVLEVDVASLDTIHVVEKPAMPPLGLMRMAGFDDRRKMGIGRFIDSTVFQKEQSRRLIDILRSYVAVRINEWSGSAAISSRSGNLSIRQLPSGDLSDKRAGAKPACYSQVFVDGMKVYEPSVGRTLFDLNSLSPNMLIGAEFYSGPAGTPAMYGGLGASCGTLVLWTRQ